MAGGAVRIHVLGDAAAHDLCRPCQSVHDQGVGMAVGHDGTGHYAGSVLPVHVDGGLTGAGPYVGAVISEAVPCLTSPPTR